MLDLRSRVALVTGGGAGMGLGGASRFNRLTDVDDIADAAILLVTNASMSGQTVVVDLANVMH